MAKKKGIPGLSFSLKRALGVSQAKAKVSKSIGIPLTKSGRRRKAGAAIGCAFPLLLGITTVSFLLSKSISIISNL